MAESNFIESINNETNDKFQSVVRRKLERFRTKLSELLFTTNQNTVNNFHNSNSSILHSPHNHQQYHQQPDENNSMLISNYYYGYTSPITEEDLRLSCKKKSKKFYTNTSSSSSSSSSACSSSSSMIIDDDEHSNLSSYSSQPGQNGDFILSQYPVNFDGQFSLPHSLTTGVINLNKNNQTANQPSTLDYYSFNSQLNSNHSCYDTSSLKTNEEENPFLSKRLTDQIHFNADLNLLSNYFEHALDLIEDMDNFFNIEFMTNYISYILLKQINDSNLKLAAVSSDKNLLKEIAEKIFLESRDEPCGLKGCNISIFVRNHEQENSLVKKFQFGTSRFGCFDMNLFLNMDTISEFTVNEQSTIATLTRKIFSTKSNSSNTNKQYPSDNTKIVYLDSTSYDLFKTNLAYE